MLPLTRVLLPSICALLLLASFPIPLSSVFAGPGTAYLVVGSDTAIWNAGTTVDVYSRHPHYKQDSFTMTNSPSFRVMDPLWRDQFRDFYGNPIKFTWWIMGGNIFREADNLNVPIANTMVLYLMKKYHGDAIRQFGDEVSAHYHTFLWSDYNGDGKFYWNQSRTFNECRDDFDFTLSQYLLEEEVFPVSFRSGWHFMDYDWQSHLNELLPFSMHDDYGVFRPWPTNAEPVAGVEDWSRAPSAFVPFHPSTNDYQVPGNGKGWNVRSVKMQNMVQSQMDQIFLQASNGVDQVACIWNHLPEDFVTNVAKMGSYVRHSASNYPAVPFRYCTAVEAMQRWLGVTNHSPPQIDVQETIEGETLTLKIATGVPIFQDRPFVCLRDAVQNYTNITASCLATGSNVWTVILPVPRNILAKVGIAATDPDGNLATRILRYLPDDLFIDNLDAEYSELQGNWTSSTNFTWGTDARVAALTSNSTARAQWFLPISRYGAYNLSLQIPSFAGAATNILFSVISGSSNIASVSFTNSLPPNQWVYLCSPILDQASSNYLQMEVNGTNQGGVYAITDVIRLRPIADTNPLPAVQIAIALGTNGFLLHLEGVSGQTCEIQRSPTLGSGWSTIETVNLPPEGVLEYEDKNPLQGRAFYRVRTP
jgi:hypothetical protein